MSKERLRQILAKATTKQNLIWLSIGVALFVLAYAYFTYEKYFPTTDDAYVQAHIINIAPQINGSVSKIRVSNNQFVKKGKLLFEIDPRPFQAAVEEAQAKLIMARQQMEANIAAVSIAKANIDKAQAQLTVDEKSYQRTSTLVAKGQASMQSGDDANGKLLSSQAALAAANNQYVQAQKNLGQIGDFNAQIRQAKAELENAKINLGYCYITAPTDGYVTNFELRTGTTILAQQTLFEFVESGRWYIYANYKETQMSRIKVNQTAKITLDMYPGHTYHGYVESISRGSGAAFSLLPAENATGNWVKVTQRFPVKVLVLDPDPEFPLRVGASSTVKINTLHYYINRQP